MFITQIVVSKLVISRSTCRLIVEVYHNMADNIISVRAQYTRLIDHFLFNNYVYTRCPVVTNGWAILLQ